MFGNFQPIKDIELLNYISYVYSLLQDLSHGTVIF